MNKFKKLAVCALTACMAGCLALGITACTTRDYPDYINPDGSDSSGTKQDKYVISVVSKGGLPLNGVRVSAKKDGATMLSGISINGKVELPIEQDEYDLVVDESTLPEGYSVGNESFKTSATDWNATVSISSGVISSTAPSGNTYALGDVMYNFTFTDLDGSRHALADLVSEYKAVMLNFWYTTCGPCQAEFPAIQKAYDAFSDKLAVVAMHRYDNTSLDEIAKFKAEQEALRDIEYTFNITQDTAGIANMFGVLAYPTTVIVDRYGVVVYKDSGTITDERIWKNVFDKYTSDDYVQTAPDDDPDDNPDQPDRAKPNVDDPDYSAMLSNVLGKGAAGKVTSIGPETNEKDAPYSWPWLPRTDAETGLDYITPSNAGVNFSFAIAYMNVSLEDGDVLSYDYFVDTEKNADLFHVLINGDIIESYSGDSNGWQTEYAAYIANGKTELELAIIYIKDEQNDGGTETVRFGNITVTNIAEVERATDMRYEATKKNSDGSLSYAQYELGADGYYRVKGKNGKADTLLLADLLNNTMFTSLHSAVNSFSPEEDASLTYPVSLYYYSYWYFNEAEEGVTIMYDGIDFSDAVINNFYMQKYSENGYVAVNEELKEAIDAFARAFCTKNKLTYYDDMWLEFCTYFQHFGNPHVDEPCNETLLPSQGMFKEYALKAKLGEQIADNARGWAMEGGGVMFEFTADKAGVYEISSKTEKSSIDPALFVYTYNAESGDYDDMLIQETSRNYDVFAGDDLNNFCAYVALAAGEKCYIQATSTIQRGATDAYTVKIDYMGERHKQLVYCTLEDGVWTYETLPNGQVLDHYIAIPRMYDTSIDCYRAVDEEGNMWDKIYIDFIRPNFFDNNGHTLYEIMKSGAFNNLPNNAASRIRYYYNKALANTGELHGMTEATAELVNILVSLTNAHLLDGDDVSSGYWLSMACYYEYYGYTYDQYLSENND